MRNGISARMDEDLLLLFREIQKLRLEKKIDRYKKSVTEISYIASKILKEKEILDKMVYAKG